MTRSIGDLVANSVGVTAEPEVKVFSNLTQNEKILVVASDGLWDRLTNSEIMNIITKKYYAKRDAEGAVAHLMRESVDRW